MRDAWSHQIHDVVQGLQQVKERSLEFNYKVFGNIGYRKKKLEPQIRGVERSLENWDYTHLEILLKELQEEYARVLCQEELFWFQKSREKWVKFGDRNTTFFHAQSIIRRKRNKIHGLFLQDGSWSTDDEVLRREALMFYRNLFAANPEEERHGLDLETMPCLSIRGKQALMLPVSKEEVRIAIMSMKSFKAPGPDGFQPFFFKRYWDIVGDDLWHLVASAFSNGRVDPDIVETLIVLIPKGEQPVHLKNFRPISLCNVIYKVITKVLVNRLRPFLDELVGPLQGSFIPGRGTTDNVVVAQEVLHYMHKTKIKKGVVAFKIDLEKAYDRVNWNFLQETLVDFGFPDIIVRLIMSCVQSSSWLFCGMGQDLKILLLPEA